MKGEGIELLKAISSNAEIINSLRDGPKHSTDIAKELNITRVAVDKRFKKLKSLGMIEREPSLSRNSDRTIIMYKLSEACHGLLDSIGNDVGNFYEQKQRELDILLATDKIDEKYYIEQKSKLKNELENARTNLK